MLPFYIKSLSRQYFIQSPFVYAPHLFVLLVMFLEEQEFLLKVFEICMYHILPATQTLFME